MTRSRRVWASLVVAASAAGACAPTGAPSVLDPKGLGGPPDRGSVVADVLDLGRRVAVVVAFLAVAYLRSHRNQSQLTEARWRGPS
jgi:hypothetical protein